MFAENSPAEAVKYVWSPTLGSFEDTPENIWGVESYDFERDKEKPTVFCGIYGLHDWYKLWRHRGKRYIFWCGSDIRYFRNDYWLDSDGTLRIDSEQLAPWISRYCESWVENEVEQRALFRFGIKANVCPSFLGDYKNFPLSYKHSKRPKLYTSVSGDDFDTYGWKHIPMLAAENPGVEFHLYGNTKPWGCGMLNVFVHGRVPKEQMNEEIARMQGALRLTEFDGFSEVLAKSVLMGQYPVSPFIKYPHMLGAEGIATLVERREPNTEGRDFYTKTINRFPWVSK